MPELPEVEILARHLGPLLQGRTIRAVHVRRPKVLAPTPVTRFQTALRGARFLGLERRGKYLLFQLRAAGRRDHLLLLGHLGMTGRMFLAGKNEPLPKHAAVILDLGEIFYLRRPALFWAADIGFACRGKTRPRAAGRRNSRRSLARA